MQLEGDRAQLQSEGVGNGLCSEAHPLYEDESGAVRVGESQVLLELVIRAFRDGVSPETIALRYETLLLPDVYGAIAYYLRHPDAVAAYLEGRERLAESVRQRWAEARPDLKGVRDRLLLGKSQLKTPVVCDACGCDRARVRRLPRTYGKGEDLLVVENVPVVSCPNCGTSYLTAATLKALDRIKRDRKTG